MELPDNLDFSTPDVNGFVAADSLTMVGTPLRHYRREGLYFVKGFVWHGDTDEWHVSFTKSGCPVVFTRTLANFRGVVDGQPRFKPIAGRFA